MPIPSAQLTKATIRKAVSVRIVHKDEANDWWPETTTGAGNAGGTTAVFSSLVGYPRSSFINKYLLITSGTYGGASPQWRIITDFATATGTITVARAYGGQIASDVTAEIHFYRPDLCTLAINRALAMTYPNGAPITYRPMLQHIFVVNSAQRNYSTPPAMRTVYKVSVDRTGSQRMLDYFDRAASTTDPGSLWTANVGTGGITSESLYFPGDTDGDTILPVTNPQIKNGIIEAMVRGDTTASHFRVVSVEFRRDSATDFLYVRIVNGQVDLRKRDASGTDGSLATGTLTTTEAVDYILRIMFDGAWIRVWVDNVEYITYELVGTDRKFLGADESGTGTYGNVGFRLDKTGTPSLAATATLVREYRLHELAGTTELRDWDQSYDGRGVQLFTRGVGRGLSTDKVLWFEGMAPLTLLAEDTTFGTLTTDTTALVEIQEADPAYQVVVDYAVSYLHLASGEREDAAAAGQRAVQTKRTFAMPLPVTATRHV